jgi:hypothetical protein
LANFGEFYQIVIIGYFALFWALLAGSVERTACLLPTEVSGRPGWCSVKRAVPWPALLRSEDESQNNPRIGEKFWRSFEKFWRSFEEFSRSFGGVFEEFWRSFGGVFEEFPRINSRIRPKNR